jgi:hypothetical protein
MANQCCCKNYNTIKNCIGCDTGSFANYTVTAHVNGFSNVYACDVATHVNRVLIHDFGSISNTTNSQCRNTLIVGNASPPESWCQSWCPPSSLHQAPNLDLGNNCPPDTDIGAYEIPACVVSQLLGVVSAGGWECRCRDLCSHNKTIYRGPSVGFVGPSCYLTIWYTVDFKFNESDPANSAVEYYISFYLADTSKSASSQITPCDDGAAKFCPGPGLSTPALVLITFGGEGTYNANQACSGINVNIPLCPFRGGYLCDWNKPQYPSGTDPGCLSWEYLCGYPLDFNSANVNLTVNLS